MSDDLPEQPYEDDDDVQILLIVVGAHLRAEVADRPLAYYVQERIDDWLTAHEEALELQIDPIVCSDVWYINEQDLHERPTISIGGPGVNALSAYFAEKLDAALVREDQVVVQLDSEFVELRASVWGMDHDSTVEAVELFVERFLPQFLRAVATQIEPRDT